MAHVWRSPAYLRWGTTQLPYCATASLCISRKVVAGPLFFFPSGRAHDPCTHMSGGTGAHGAVEHRRHDEVLSNPNSTADRHAWCSPRAALTITYPPSSPNSVVAWPPGITYALLVSGHAPCMPPSLADLRFRKYFAGWMVGAGPRLEL